MSPTLSVIGKPDDTNVEKPQAEAKNPRLNPSDCEALLKETALKIEGAIISNSPLSDGSQISDFQKFVYLSLFGHGSKRNVGDISDKVDNLQDQIADIDSDMTKHDDEINDIKSSLSKIDDNLIRLQVEAYENKYILKGISLGGTLSAGGTKGSNQTTLSTVTKILEMADLSIHSIVDAFRLCPKKNHGNKNLRSNQASQTIKKVPNILVKFCGPRPIEKLFSKMGTIRETFKDAQLEVLCPPLLLPLWNSVNAEAFELRQKKMSTRTLIRGTTVKLFAKTKGSSGDFVEMPLPE